ncbi:hypothetical protein [Acutalibacter muris]|uniref:hypothetical protein n=1 Tax=Acutalibacter muris TaxID=1796620 RepID=UPI001C3ED2F5|nr:hypothetical protein [Acutalibacter muris]
MANRTGRLKARRELNPAGFWRWWSSVVFLNIGEFGTKFGKGFAMDNVRSIDTMNPPVV